MLYLVAALAAVSIALLTMALVQLVPTRPAEIGRRLADLQELGGGAADQKAEERRRRRQQWEGMLRRLGERMEQGKKDAGGMRPLLIQAGYRHPDAVAIFWGIRLMAPLAPFVVVLLLSPLFGSKLLPLAIPLSIVGFVAPTFYVGSRARKRQTELRIALPDALDSLVVCVEAGLGLNQAIVRVAAEIRHISQLMSEELGMINLEIRAGTPRDEALRHFADRTGVEDIQALVTMLVQTDKFGTSVARALRVQADSLRTKRRQRAEEAAAKTTVKMLFPLIFCIFPALFVVLLGPAVLDIAKSFKAILG